MPTAEMLDACVLVPAALRDLLLGSADTGLYQPYWSEDTLNEVERTLAGGFVCAERARSLSVRMQGAFPSATLANRRYAAHIEAMTNHPKDRHVVAAVVVAGVRLIVTRNLKDFPDRALAPFGIAAQAPDRFLCDLFALAPQRFVEILHQRAAALRRPPMQAERVLDNLSFEVPEFVRLVRSV